MTGLPQLDSEFVRAQFPNIGDWAFFENAGGTFVPSAVSDRVHDYMRRNQVQPGAPYPASAEAMERLERGHRALAEMIGADAQELVIGHSTTMNVYVLSRALRPLFQPGDEIIVTNLDHEANSGAWRRLADEGITVKEWRIDPSTASLDGLERLEPLLSDRTRLVCVTWCSNITGAISDMEEIVRAAHDIGAWVCADAVALAPHRALELGKSGVDFCLFSLYKLYGPHLGALFGKRERLLAAESQNHFFLPPAFALQPGGYQHETVASIEGIVEYVEQVHAHHFADRGQSRPQRYAETFDLFARHEDAISAPLLEYLSARRDIRIIGPGTADRRIRVPTISFVADGREASELPEILGRRGLGIGSGHFYAKRCIDALGLDGVTRISMAHYNTREEVERLIQELDIALG